MWIEIPFFLPLFFLLEQLPPSLLDRKSSNLLRHSPNLPFQYDMVSYRLIPLSSDMKTDLDHPPIHQPPIPDDNNISLLIDRESSILKLDRPVCYIMRRGG